MALAQLGALAAGGGRASRDAGLGQRGDGQHGQRQQAHREAAARRHGGAARHQQQRQSSHTLCGSSLHKKPHKKPRVSRRCCPSAARLHPPIPQKTLTSVRTPPPLGPSVRTPRPRVPQHTLCTKWHASPQRCCFPSWPCPPPSLTSPPARRQVLRRPAPPHTTPCAPSAAKTTPAGGSGDGADGGPIADAYPSHIYSIGPSERARAAAGGRCRGGGAATGRNVQSSRI